MTDLLELTLPNQRSAISGFQDQLEGFARRTGLPDRVLHELQLALEEHLTNIVSYGYEDEREHAIHIRLHVDTPQVQIEVTDDGAPFNPLEHPAPDLTIPVEERPIGGLGIHMMREALDEMTYRREHGKNILRMTKRTG